MTIARRTTPLHKTLLGSVILLAACLTLLAPSQGVTGKSGAREDKPQVINRTAGFQVESLTLKDGDYFLSLKNTYDKSINGYTLGTGRGAKLTVELTTGEFVIAPGDVAQARIAASNIRPPQGQDTQRQITILAVLFEDGTSDGDSQAIGEVTGRRKGAKVQLKRVLTLVEAILASPEADDRAALNKLKARITSLSEDPEGGMPPNTKSGLRNAKEDALMILQSLEQHGVSPQDGLSQLKGSIEKRISRL